MKSEHKLALPLMLKILCTIYFFSTLSNIFVGIKSSMGNETDFYLFGIAISHNIYLTLTIIKIICQGFLLFAVWKRNPLTWKWVVSWEVLWFSGNFVNLINYKNIALTELQKMLADPESLSAWKKLVSAKELENLMLMLPKYFEFVVLARYFWCLVIGLIFMLVFITQRKYFSPAKITT